MGSPRLVTKHPALCVPTSSIGRITCLFLVQFVDDDDLELEEEGEISDDPQSMAMTSAALNESLSDSINLFQAIHVLQGEEDEMAFKKNETSSCKYLPIVGKMTNVLHYFCIF